MAQIKKYRRGDELLQIQQLDAQIAEAESLATEEAKAQAKTLADNAIAYQQADRMTTRDNRRFAIDMKKAILATLKGEQAYNPYNVGTADKNLFGFYSSPEVNNISNEITKQTLTPKPAEVSPSADVTSTPNQVAHYMYAWDKGWNPISLEQEDLKAKMGRLVNHLIANTQGLISAKNSGKRIHGTPYEFSNYQTWLNQLTQVKQMLETSDPRELYQPLSQIAGMLGMDKTSWDLYFKGVAPVQSQTEINKENLRNNQYDVDGFDFNGQSAQIQSMLTNGNYHVAVKDGHFYLFDKNWEAVKNHNYINTDYFDTDNYHWGMFSNDEGEVWFGNTQDKDTFTNNHPFYNQYSKYITDHFKDYDDLHYISSKAMDDLWGSSDYDILNKAAAHFKKLHGKQMRYADVSQLFGTDKPVIAVTKNGADFKKDVYGNILLNDSNLEFYYEKDGKVMHSPSLQGVTQNVGQFKHTGWGEPQSSMDYTDLLDGRDLNDTQISGDIYVSDARNNAWSHEGGQSGWDITDWETIKENPSRFVKTVMDILLKSTVQRTTDEMAYLQRLGYGDDPAKFVNGLASVIKTYHLENTLTPEMKKLLQDMLITYRKEGGIVSAREGAPLNVWGQEVSPTTDRQLREERLLGQHADYAKYATGDPQETARETLKDRKVTEEWKTEDFIRFGAIGADIASMISAFAGPHGMAASGFLGAGSTAANLTADLMDDSVSGWEVAKGVGFGLAMDALGMLPAFAAEATGAKVLKNVAKYAPRLIAMGMAGTMILNPETMASLKKAVDGKSNTKLTVSDWRNIAYAFSAAAGLTRAGRSAYLTKQAKNQAQIVRNGGPKMTIESNDGKVIDIPAELQESFKSAIEAKDIAKANEIIQQIPGHEASTIKTKDSKRFGLFGETQTKLNTELETTPADVAYDFNKLSTKEWGKASDKWSNRNWVENQIASGQTRRWNPVKWGEDARAWKLQNRAKVAEIKNDNNRIAFEGLLDTPEGVTARSEAYNKTRTDAENRRQEYLTQNASKRETAEKALTDWRNKTGEEYTRLNEEASTKNTTLDAEYKSAIEAKQVSDRRAAALQRYREALRKQRRARSTKTKEAADAEVLEARREMNQSGARAYFQSYKDALRRDHVAEFTSSAEGARHNEYLRKKDALKTERDAKEAETLSKLQTQLSEARKAERSKNKTSLAENLTKLSEERKALEGNSTTSAPIKAQSTAPDGKTKSVTIKKGTKVRNLQGTNDSYAARAEAEFRQTGDVVELNKNSFVKEGAETTKQQHVRKVLYNSQTKELLVLKKGAKLDRLHNFINNK